ncbi:hypothetical protein [Marinicella meishanensis]|uniref:hypothetical protein n=1 Tax=Marinicella meishanensis TaxID=2873263 RepID=UPI001CC0E16D|nr:hypothetical protein [Marinicella sp. NBU2979]
MQELKNHLEQNPYQAKLAAIKARRLGWLQRIYSLLACVCLLSGGIFLLPVTFSILSTFIIHGSLHPHMLMEQLGIYGLVITVLALPAMGYLVYHCFSWCLKHFVRFLSGIRES